MLQDCIIYEEFGKAVVFDENCEFKIKKSFVDSSFTAYKDEYAYYLYINSGKDLDII